VLIKNRFLQERTCTKSTTIPGGRAENKISSRPSLFQITNYFEEGIFFMQSEFTVIVDDDRKYILVKYLSIEKVIAKKPCGTVLVDFIKKFPRNLLLLEIDPYFTTNRKIRSFRKLIQTLYDNEKWYSVLEFLENSGFIKWEVPTKDELKKFIKNRNRRIARKRKER